MGDRQVLELDVELDVCTALQIYQKKLWIEYLDELKLVTCKFYLNKAV